MMALIVGAGVLSWAAVAVMWVRALRAYMSRAAHVGARRRPPYKGRAERPRQGVSGSPAATITPGTGGLLIHHPYSQVHHHHYLLQVVQVRLGAIEQVRLLASRQPLCVTMRYLPNAFSP